MVEWVNKCFTLSCIMLVLRTIRCAFCPNMRLWNSNHFEDARHGCNQHCLIWWDCIIVMLIFTLLWYILMMFTLLWSIRMHFYLIRWMWLKYNEWILYVHWSLTPCTLINWQISNIPRLRPPFLGRLNMLEY